MVGLLWDQWVGDEVMGLLRIWGMGGMGQGFCYRYGGWRMGLRVFYGFQGWLGWGRGLATGLGDGNMG